MKIAKCQKVNSKHIYIINIFGNTKKNIKCMKNVCEAFHNNCVFSELKFCGNGVESFIEDIARFFITYTGFLVKEY